MAENTTPNPLTKYFRQPVLYINLPSKGKWYPNATVELPVTGSIPVYAMTAKDEITMKTPDALLNGQSTVSVIESCCPNIKDAWKLPLVDLDTVLIAIRIASYGNEMDFACICPHCNTKTELAVDLSVVLGNIKTADWDTPTNVAGLQINLRPQRFDEFNKNNLMNYEEQRLLQVVSSNDLTEDEKVVKFNEMFGKIVSLGITQVSKSIASIVLEDGTEVSNPDHIAEFLANCDRAIWDELRKRIDAMRDVAQIKLTTPCENPECGKEFETPFVFEQSSFFG